MRTQGRGRGRWLRQRASTREKRKKGRNSRLFYFDRGRQVGAENDGFGQGGEINVNVGVPSKTQ